jgi:ATP-binding cassette subfamily C (CFTR/MRP) protein 1
LAAVLSFVTYSLSGHELNVATIFASLQLFNVIEAPMTALPMVITALSDVQIAILRITKILTAEEQAHGLIIDPTLPLAVEAVGDFAYETAVPPDQLESGPRPGDKKANREARKKDKEERKSRKKGDGREISASASEKDEEVLKPFTLTDIDLRIEKGSFVCIYGRIGSGKTALLEGLLGEMRQSRGLPVKFGGSVSLVTQTPWIQSASLQDNILFGSPFDSARMQETIHACALIRDLEQLSDGISTEIGGE